MKIITLVDRNEDFIPVQYESIKKHVKEPFEYIVFNNGSTKEQKNKIRKLCKRISVECKDMICIMKECNFPNPYNIDFIMIDGKFSVVHFKSANWNPDYTKEYVDNKKSALKKLLERL